MPIILAFGKQGKEDQDIHSKFDINLVIYMRPCFKEAERGMEHGSSESA